MGGWLKSGLRGRTPRLRGIRRHRASAWECHPIPADLAPLDFQRRLVFSLLFDFLRHSQPGTRTHDAHQDRGEHHRRDRQMLGSPRVLFSNLAATNIYLKWLTAMHSSLQRPLSSWVSIDLGDPHWNLPSLKQRCRCLVYSFQRRLSSLVSPFNAGCSAGVHSILYHFPQCTIRGQGAIHSTVQLIGAFAQGWLLDAPPQSRRSRHSRSSNQARRLG